MARVLILLLFLTSCSNNSIKRDVASKKKIYKVANELDFFRYESSCQERSELTHWKKWKTENKTILSRYLAKTKSPKDRNILSNSLMTLKFTNLYNRIPKSKYQLRFLSYLYANASSHIGKLLRARRWKKYLNGEKKEVRFPKETLRGSFSKFVGKSPLNLAEAANLNL